MPTKAKSRSRKNMKTTKKKVTKLKFGRSNKHWVLFVIMFALVGSYIVFRSFAATNTVTYAGQLSSSNPSTSYKISVGDVGKLTASVDSRDEGVRVSLLGDSSIESLGSRAGSNASISANVSPGAYTVVVDYSREIKGVKKYKVTITYPVMSSTPPPAADTTPPTALITSPTSDTVSGTVTVSATAQDNVAVSRVEFIVDGNVVSTDSTSPYNYSWDTTTVADGTHNLNIKAYDTSNNVGAASRPVTVKDETPPPTPTTLKPFPKGLVTTDPTSINLYPYASYVTIKSVNWAQVEPSPGNYDWSSIDNTINATKAKNPNAKFRIRLYSGRQAPDWIKNIGGPCVQIEPDSVNGGSGCVPRFWTDAYIDRYETLMDAFAAKYERNAAVVDLVNSACSTIFAESFILGADTASVDRLWQAGLTEAGHRNCLNRTTAKMMQAFPTSRVTIAGHGKWQIIVQGPNGAGDGARADSWEKERELLNGWRTTYGEKLVVEEHGLGPTDYCAPGQNVLTASSFYCWFASLPSPKGLQFTLNGGSMETAATNGVNMGACFLEYAAFQAITEPRRQEIHNQLLGNCD
jgi:hypothetical protein